MKKYVFIIVCAFIIVGCSNSVDPKTESGSNEEVEPSSVSINFGEVDVIVKKNTVHVTGEVKTNEAVFYYTLEQGESVLVEETEVTLGDKQGDWNAFELENSLSEVDEEDEEVPIIKLYAKDGEKVINSHFVPIDLMNY